MWLLIASISMYGQLVSINIEIYRIFYLKMLPMGGNRRKVSLALLVKLRISFSLSDYRFMFGFSAVNSHRRVQLQRFYFLQVTQCVKVTKCSLNKSDVM